MADIEKVIEGLKMCQYSSKSNCDGCPYAYDAMGYINECTADLASDALELLKEQEARLLTFEEVKKHYSIPGELLKDIHVYVDYANDIEPLYLECPDDDGFVVHWRIYDSIAKRLDDWREDYGKTWRCWTKKPTIMQRMAVKWE